MRHIVLVFPDWVGSVEEEDVLRQTLPALSWLAEHGEVIRLSADPPVETPEALALGLPPDTVKLRQGPLTISALGADPPERSTHFHLSLLGHSDGTVLTSDLEPRPEELRVILEEAKKLNTKVLTLVKGEGRDHGLVWEGWGDMATRSPADSGKSMRSVWPEGDADTILRRYIDDSINLLSGLELNQIRAAEGHPLLNLLWPWGDGIRTRVPNLALRRGTPSAVVTNSLRMSGLARLAGYRPIGGSKLRKGINIDLGFARKTVLTEVSSILYLPVFAELRANSMIEEAAWFTKRIDQELLEPIVDQLATEPMRLTLMSPSVGHPGLGLDYETGNPSGKSYPFDARALEEKMLRRGTSWEAVQANLNP